MTKLWRGLFWTVVILGGIALLLRVTLFDVWRLGTDPHFAAALAPTLRGGDAVLLLTRGEPGFGDLVRCTDPDNPAEFVVGRIAGVAGDHLVVEGPMLEVNNKKYVTDASCPESSYPIAHPSSGATIDLACDEVKMGSSWHYRGQSMKPLFSRSRVTADVGSGMVYLLSDDRDYHDDSRDFGPVPRSSCKERIVFRFWGTDGFQKDTRRFEVIR